MTSTTVGLAAVAAPPVRPPVVGLIPALSDLDIPGYLVDGETETIEGADQPQRWVTGFKYQTEQMCAAPGVTDPCGPAMSNPPSEPAWVQGVPALVWAEDFCSTFGYAAHDFKGRAIRALLGSESKQIAAELWNGTQAQASGWPNTWLASGNTNVHTVTSGGVTPGVALALLEQYIASSSNGQQGAIHCTRQLGSALSELGNTFRSVNGLILTYMGNVIIPDAGYPGTGPTGQAAGATQWAFATLLPQVRRSPILVYPDTFEEAIDLGYANTGTQNSLAFRAERYATATFPPCTLGAAQVTLQVPA